MNTFEKTPTPSPSEYRPILSPNAQGGVRTDSQEGECCCPDLCQIDHDN